MQPHNQRTTRGDHGFDIGAWENEGGALGRSIINHNYGRRVEGDRSWTVYHVFSGVPAVVGGRLMTGLERGEATATMIGLNARNALKRKQLAEAARSRLTQAGDKP
ncbi:hypothetical protein C7441_11617 [Pseudaminobacter salicylatoxidans]|uniref:Uncharacterized protein n=1 Tax=Pseudaminobacter salicylatoxidans TaxID=93369 RepID=A0A316BX40_PSESE|nr:hypothetical protein C7441_11617 [Pseudaminobacter salicylatoxidans]